MNQKQTRTMKPGKILTAVLLSLLFLFLFSVLASAASAQASIGNKKYATLGAALKAVKNGETVRLNTNITTQKAIKINRNVKFTLDLGGKTVKDTSKENGNLREYGKTYTGTLHIAKGKVTIKNGTISGTSLGAALTVASGASLTIASGTYLRNITNWGGTLTINGGKISSTDYCAISNEGGKLTINNATVSSNSYCVEAIGGTVQVKKGVFTSGSIAFCLSEAKLTIATAKVKSKNYCLYLINKSTATVKKGTYVSTNHYFGAIGVLKNSKMTISGGTYRTTYKHAIETIFVANGALTIKGGTVSGNISAIAVGNEAGGKAPELTITGGKIFCSSKSTCSPIRSSVRKQYSIKLNCITANPESKAIVPASAEKEYSKAFVAYATKNKNKIQYWH